MLRLHNSQLLKLAALGIFEYDPRSITLRYVGDADNESWLERFLQAES